jgi:type IX secretion system PorP/SprF family membrane protein
LEYEKKKLDGISVLLGCTCFAQQKPYYTQYILNNYILNPALSGIENYTDVKLSHRQQWTGIDGAPITTYMSIHAPIGMEQDAERNTPTSFGKAGTNVRGKIYHDDYTAPNAHQGIGMIILNDKTGYINRFSLYGTYAYHKPLGPVTTLSVGFLAGFSNVGIDREKITLPQPGVFDQAIGVLSGEVKKLLPEIGAGIWLYSKDYFVGASVLNIIPGKAKLVSSAKGTYYVPHFFASAGYRFWMNEDISMLPSVALQFIQPTPVQAHFNVKLQYQDLAWLGASYRATDQLGGFAAMLGFNVSNTFNIGYAYDLSTTSRLRNYTRNTHEIIIGFLLNNKYGDTCPRNVW